MSPRWAIPSAPIRPAACPDPPTAGRPGSESSFGTITREPSISPWTSETRASCSRPYGTPIEPRGGLFQSNDAGANWTLVSADRNIRQRAFYFSRITADPKRRDTVYALNVEIYRSDDGGKTLRRFQTPHSDHHDLWIAPNDSQRIASSDDGGGSVSTDAGQTWTLQAYATAQLYHVSTTAEFPYHVCGAQQDDGTICAPSDPRAPGNTYSAGGGEAG